MLALVYMNITVDMLLRLLNLLLAASWYLFEPVSFLSMSATTISLGSIYIYSKCGAK